MIVVFAGPSVAHLASDRMAGMEVRPPAACGDLLRAIRQGATAIGLIDGLFEATASVWHKEILFGIAEGVRIAGASSMGALRAAECHIFGMEGVGRVFADYAAGRRTADADVAVLHAPAELGFAPLTLALVNADATIERMETLQHVTTEEASALRDAARSLHYKERTWSAIAAIGASDEARRRRMLDLAHDDAVDQKARDAEELFERLRQPQPAPAGDRITRARFNRTAVFALLEERL